MRGIKRLIGSAMLGVLALAVLYFTAPYTGVYIPVSRLSVAVSAVLGVPGVTLLVLLSLLYTSRCIEKKTAVLPQRRGVLTCF